MKISVTPLGRLDRFDWGLVIGSTLSVLFFLAAAMKAGSLFECLAYVALAVIWTTIPVLVVASEYAPRSDVGRRKT